MTNLVKSTFHKKYVLNDGEEKHVSHWTHVTDGPDGKTVEWGKGHHEKPHDDDKPDFGDWTFDNDDWDLSDLIDCFKDAKPHKPDMPKPLPDHKPDYSWDGHEGSHDIPEIACVMVGEDGKDWDVGPDAIC
jgi:hypothetical protein